MLGLAMKTVAVFTVIAGAAPVQKPSRKVQAGAAKYKPPVQKPSLYSQGVMGIPVPTEEEPTLKDWFGGDFKPPEAKPSLYSLGIVPPKPKPLEIKIGKGLIGEGALLGGPYKPPVAKPSLYSQGIGKGRGWTYIFGGPFALPKPSAKTFDATGMAQSNKYERQNIWVNLLLGGPYIKPSPGYGDPAVPERYAKAVPAEAAPEGPILDKPSLGNNFAQSTPAFAEETSGPSVLSISIWMLFGFSMGSGITMTVSRLLRRDLPANGQEPLMTA